jgi:hypothetical protein
MATGLSYTLGGLSDMQRSMAEVIEGLPQYIAAANRESAEEIRDLARRNLKDIDAYDTGETYESVAIASTRLGLVYAVGSAAKQAPFIEFGTRPHFPPVSAIAAWCRRKGIPESAAFPIARAIGERGTPERPWLRPAFIAVSDKHVTRLREAVATGLGKLLKREVAI